MAEPARPAGQQHLSLNEAADIIGGTPWDVMRLVDARKVEFIPLVDRTSLLQYLEAHR